VSSLKIDYLQHDAYSAGQLFTVCRRLRPYLGVAAELYPDFDSWFMSKTVPGLLLNERSLVFAHQGSSLAGFAILKHTQNEDKICTFCVLPSHRERGVGGKLMAACLRRFGRVMPGITVAERLLSQFEPLLKRFGFGNPLAFFELYRRGDAEYVYDPSRRILPTFGSGYYYRA